MISRNSVNNIEFLKMFFISLAICAVVCLFLIFKYDNDMEKECVSKPLCNRYYQETGKYNMNSDDFNKWLSSKNDDFLKEVYR